MTPLKDSRFTEKLFGKLFADRGYISQDLFEMLFVDDIHLVTKIKKNMKNSLMNLYDKLMLRKRSVMSNVSKSSFRDWACTALGLVPSMFLMLLPTHGQAEK